MVTTTEFVMDMIPWVADEHAIIKSEVKTMFKRDYFIVAHTVNGARFYSENIDWEDTTEMFRKYKSLTSYFGGGNVQLYERVFDDYKIIRNEIVW